MMKRNPLFEDAHEFLRVFMLFVASIQQECYDIAKHEDEELLRADILQLAQKAKYLLRDLKKLKKEDMQVCNEIQKANAEREAS